MLKARLDAQSLAVICPTCYKSNFTIFRRDKLSVGAGEGGEPGREMYLNHCKCENCGQLFIYNVDKKNNPVGLKPWLPKPGET